MFKAEGKMVEISPQQIISCDATDDDCNGGVLITRSRAMKDVVVVVYYGSEQVRPSQFTD